MTFDSPSSLFWLALAVPIVIFYILKIRLRRQPVSTVMFWKQVLDEQNPRSIWQRLRHRTYEPHLIQIHDPAEAKPNLLGEIELVDIETDSLRKVTITERALREYRRVFHDFQTGVAAYGKKYGLGCTQTTNDVDFEDLVLRMMRTAGAVN